MSFSVKEGFHQVIGDTLSQWAAAKESRFKRERDLPVNGAGADYHFSSETDYYRVGEYARSMERDDAIVRPALLRASYLSVGDGFAFKPDSGNKKYDLAWWEDMQEWMSNPALCDMSGENHFGEMTRIIMQSSLRDGDIWPLAVSVDNDNDIRLQLIEAHQIRTPNGMAARERGIVLGVESDDFRKRRYAYVTGESPRADQRFEEKDLVRKSIYRMVPGFGEFRQFFQVYHPDRCSQTRGVSAMAPVFDVEGMIEDINFGKLVQQLMVSCVTWIHETNEASNLPGNGVSRLQSSMIVGNEDNLLDRMEPGAVFRTKPGEKMTGFSPSVPNPEYFEQLKVALTLFGNAIGLPLIILLMDASETNFSGWRGAFDQAKEGFMSNQTTVSRRFLCPMTNLRTAIRIKSGKLKVPKSLKSGYEYRHTWGGRRWPFIQPVQDAMTAILRQRNLLASPRSVHAEMGQDFETTVDHTVNDNAYAIEAGFKKAKELNEKIKTEGDPDQPKVTWRDVISLPTYDRVSMSFSDSADIANGGSGNKPGKSAPPTKTSPAPAGGSK
jgi:capsid protein